MHIHLSLSLSPTASDNVSIFLNYSKTQIICCYMQQHGRGGERPPGCSSCYDWSPVLGSGNRTNNSIVDSNQLWPGGRQLPLSACRCTVATHTHTHTQSVAISYWEVPVFGRPSPPAASLPSWWLTASGFGFGPTDSQPTRDRAAPNAANASHY